MPDETPAPEGAEAASEGAADVLSALKERGFEATPEGLADAMAALDKKAEDLKSYKPEAKRAAELEAELEKFRQAEEERKQAQMSEAEKAKAEADKLKQELRDAEARIEQTKRDALYRETLSEALSEVNPKLRQIYRDRYTVATSEGWDDAEDLKEKISEANKAIKAELDAIMADSGGKRKPKDIFGWTRPEGQQEGKSQSPAARAYEQGGLRELLRQKRQQ